MIGPRRWLQAAAALPLPMAGAKPVAKVWRIGWFGYAALIHAGTTKALGLTVPRSLLLRADEVIE